MITIDILQMIDRLEELVNSGARLPLSSKVIIDENAFLNIIDQMRISIPQEIKQAKEIQLERDKYVAQAHEEARRILAQAREDAAKQLDEHQLRQQAQAQAEAILRRAEQDAARIRAGADEYAEAKLKELAQHLAQIQTVIQNGLATLEERRAARARKVAEEAKAQPGPTQADPAE